MAWHFEFFEVRVNFHNQSGVFVFVGLFDYLLLFFLEMDQIVMEEEMLMEIV